MQYAIFVIDELRMLNYKSESLWADFAVMERALYIIYPDKDLKDYERPKLEFPEEIQVTEIMKYTAEKLGLNIGQNRGFRF